MAALGCLSALVRPACGVLARRSGIQVGHREVARLQVVALGDVFGCQPHADFLDQDRVTRGALGFQPGVVGHDKLRRLAGAAVELPQRIGQVHALAGAGAAQAAASGTGVIGGFSVYVPALLRFTSPARSILLASPGRAAAYSSHARDPPFTSPPRDGS